MATIIICILLGIIFVYSARSYIKKISHGCCGAGGDDVKKIKPSDKNVNNYKYIFNIGIEGMTCKNCKLRVENAFNSDSNFFATVDLKQKNAVIRSKTDMENDVLKRIIEKEGYKVTSITRA